MAEKKVITGLDVWAKLMSGADKLVQAVGATLGPNGSTVLIGNQFGRPKVTKDGVTVAKNMSDKDPFEKMSMDILTAVANRMSVGDGTTSSIVFSHALLSNARKLMVAGLNVNEMIAGIEEGMNEVLKIIADNTQPISDDAKVLKEVATIAANGDQEMGERIAQAFTAVGKNGVIVVEESRSGLTEVSVVQGMQLEKGYASPLFVTNQTKGICELTDACVLVYEGQINNFAPMVKVLEEVVRAGKSLFIIADEVGGEALSALILNKLNGKLKVCAVNAPSFGAKKIELLQDIAIMTGATLISNTTIGLEDVRAMHLGFAGHILINNDSTIISSTKPDAQALKERIEQLQYAHEKEASEYNKEGLNKRIAHLTSGVAVIRVGGDSNLAVGELKDRVDDAVCSVKAAAKKGIVPGGGVIFVHAAATLASKINNHDQKSAGIKILHDSLLAMTSRIIANTGIDHYAAIVRKIYESTDVNFGYDARNHAYGDMKKFGIVDAALVVESVLKNGIDGVKTLLSTTVMIAELPESSSKDAGMGGMGGMGDYY